MSKHLLLLMTVGLMPACSHKYTCKGYPDQPACLSATEAYLATDGKGAEAATTPDPQTARSGKDRAPLIPEGHSGGKIQAGRSDSRLLRIWQAPYENAEGDLEGARYVLSEIEPRHWKIGTQGQPVLKRQAAPRALRKTEASGALSSDRGGFPLFPSSDGPTRLRVEEADDLEP